MSIRVTHGIALLGACALWACSKGDNKADSAAAADSAARSAAPATTPAAAAPAPMTDANILALLDEANANDSAGGSIAMQKGTNAQVKAFGRDMARDHHKLRKDGQDLAKKLNITPAPPSGDTLSQAGQKQADMLNSAPKGASFDKTYIDGEVAVHQSVLSLLQGASSAAQDTTLKGAITKAQPLIEAHLKKAQEIQSKLGSGAAGDSAAKSGGAASSKKKP